MSGRARGALPRRYHVLALSTLAGIATLLGMRSGSRAAVARRPSPARGRSWACSSICLPLAAAMPRPGWGGAADRTPGIVLARYRQAQADVAADDRPVPQPSAPALLSACMPAVLAPDPTGCSDAWSVRDEPRVTPTPAGAPRSPPVP